MLNKILPIIVWVALVVITLMVGLPLGAQSGDLAAMPAPLPTASILNTLPEQTVEDAGIDCSQNPLDGYIPVMQSVSIDNDGKIDFVITLENVGWELRIVKIDFQTQDRFVFGEPKIVAESPLPEPGQAVTLVAYLGFDTGSAIAVGNCDGKLYWGFPQMIPYSEDS